MIIALSGMTQDPKGNKGSANSGKDTVADHLVDKYGFVKVALADPMKRFLMEVFDFTEEQLWGSSEKRNEPDKRYCRTPPWDNTPHMDPQVVADIIGPGTEAYLTPRYALQQLGTEWGRDCYNDVWVNYALRVAKKLLCDSGVAYVRTKGIVTALSRDEVLEEGASAELYFYDPGEKGLNVDLSWDPRFSLVRPGKSDFVLYNGEKVQLLGEKIEPAPGFGTSYLFRVRCASRIDPFWVSGEHLKFTSRKMKGVVIPDVRYPNENNAMVSTEMAGVRVRVRRSVSELLPGAAGNHTSEKSLIHFHDDGWDYIIENDGTEHVLRMKVDQMMAVLSGRIIPYDEEQKGIPPFLRK